MINNLRLYSLLHIFKVTCCVNSHLILQLDQILSYLDYHDVWFFLFSVQPSTIWRIIKMSNRFPYIHLFLIYQYNTPNSKYHKSSLLTLKNAIWFFVLWTLQLSLVALLVWIIGLMWRWDGDISTRIIRTTIVRTHRRHWTCIHRLHRARRSHRLCTITTSF